MNDGPSFFKPIHDRFHHFPPPPPFFFFFFPTDLVETRKRDAMGDGRRKRKKKGKGEKGNPSFFRIYVNLFILSRFRNS